MSQLETEKIVEALHRIANALEAITDRIDFLERTLSAIERK